MLIFARYHTDVIGLVNGPVLCEIRRTYPAAKSREPWRYDAGSPGSARWRETRGGSLPRAGGKRGMSCEQQQHERRDPDEITRTQPGRAITHRDRPVQIQQRSGTDDP